MRFFFLLLALLVLPVASASAQTSPAWADATPTAWHQLVNGEALLSAPEPPNPVAVCIVDSGVNLTPDLAPAVIERLAYDGGDPGDTYPQEGIDDGHGTYVATFLAGQVNGWGGAGLWPRAKIVSVRVFPPGGVRAKAADYLEGIRTCAQQEHVAVINLSLGDIDATSEELAELDQRITEYRRKNNINIVAAAGNRGGAIEVPARFPAAFAVGAADASGRLCAFSARGHGLDLSAPGCALQGGDQHGYLSTFNGTSFAAPMVSGALAALRAYGGLSAEDAERRLLETARQGEQGLQLDTASALAPWNTSWATQLPTSEVRPPVAAPIQSNAIEFVDYPAPLFKLRRRSRSHVLVRILNRPRGAIIEIVDGRTHRQVWQSHFRLRAWSRSSARRRVSFRFISHDGLSPWSRVSQRGLRRT
jgi:hypothetical protein